MNGSAEGTRRLWRNKWVVNIEWKHAPFDRYPNPTMVQDHWLTLINLILLVLWLALHRFVYLLSRFMHQSIRLWWRDLVSVWTAWTSLHQPTRSCQQEVSWQDPSCRMPQKHLCLPQQDHNKTTQRKDSFILLTMRLLLHFIKMF